MGQGQGPSSASLGVRLDRQATSSRDALSGHIAWECCGCHHGLCPPPRLNPPLSFTLCVMICHVSMYNYHLVRNTASNWVWACRGGVRQPRTGCGHAEVGFDSLELGVGMQRWGSTAMNWVWAGWTALKWVWEYRGGFHSLELHAHMQRWY